MVWKERGAERGEERAVKSRSGRGRSTRGMRRSMDRDRGIGAGIGSDRCRR